MHTEDVLHLQHKTKDVLVEHYELELLPRSVQT